MTEILEVVKYPSSVLESFGNGALLDLRVRLALDVLKSPGFVGQIVPGADNEVPYERRIAAYALDIATALLEVGAERGLVSPMPEHDELTQPIRRHIARNVRAQLHQQAVMQRVSREESPIIAGAVNPAVQ